MILVANAAVGKPWAAFTAEIVCLLSAGALLLYGVGILGGWLVPTTGKISYAQQPLGVSLIALSAVVAAATWPPAMRRLARFIPLDVHNPVDALALALAVIVIGSQFAFSVFVDLLSLEQSLPAIDLSDLLSEQLPLVLMAAVGVGAFIRRDARATTQRLGLVRPAWWHVVVALAAAGVFIAVAAVMNGLSQSLTPGLAHRLDNTSNHLLGGLVANPIGVAAIAVVPACCEETLFRGAVQPRLGIVLTALLFASIHTQYGISFDTLAVLLIGIGLGLIRKYTNTTSSAVTHATYNLVTSFGFAGLTLGIAAGVEIALILVSVYAIASRRVAQPATPNP
jgi:uncharacterized protein